MASRTTYPVRVEARLDVELSRWLWLVKWFLAIPHFIVLAFLWLAFSLLSVIAFFGILFTGRYPRTIFEFNVGVLRWSWRVSYYAYGALGTDRYPPFTLAEAPDYPARLEIAYPDRLSRGLVLIKWWLLAIPHYLIVALLIGSAAITWGDDGWAFPGLIGVLVLVAAVALAVTGRYPTGLFDLILGFNRWVLRVAAYAGLMTDEYPPFRLDMGGSEDARTLTLPGGTDTEGTSGARGREGAGGWTAGPTVTAIAGALVSLIALGFLTGGAVTLWLDRTQRDAAGFVSTPTEAFATDTYAIVTDDIVLDSVDGPDWALPSAVFDEARVRVTPGDEGSIFVGIARSTDVERYLRGVAYARADDFRSDLITISGQASSSTPGEQPFWAASSEGTGKQTIEWPVKAGSWTIVVMNADGSGGLDVRADLGAKLPVLPWIAAGLLVSGAVGLLLGTALVVGAIARAGRRG